MDNVLSSDTLSLVATLFSNDLQVQVKALLELRCSRHLALMADADSAAFERLHFAVLKLSSGSYPQLEQAIMLANTDWRDVLVAADFAHDLTAHRRWFASQYLPSN
jgi:hypothetical protein